MGNPSEGTPGKKPPAPSASRQPDRLQLLLGKTREQARIQGLDARGWSEDDCAVLHGVNQVGRIYREIIRGEPKWRWFLQTVPAPPPNQGVTDTLEQAKADFKRRYAEVKGGAK